MWFYIYTEGLGREMAPASHFVPSEFCLSGVSSKKSKSSPHCVPQVFFSLPFQFCLDPGFLLAFSPGAVQYPPGSIPAKPTDLFKTPGFRPFWLQELTKFSLSHFPSQWLWGKCCASSCVLLFLTLSVTKAPPLHSTLSHFFHKLGPYTSYLL